MDPLVGVVEQVRQVLDDFKATTINANSLLWLMTQLQYSVPGRGEVTILPADWKGGEFKVRVDRPGYTLFGTIQPSSLVTLTTKMD